MPSVIFSVANESIMMSVVMLSAVMLNFPGALKMTYDGKNYPYRDNKYFVAIKFLHYKLECLTLSGERNKLVVPK